MSKYNCPNCGAPIEGVKCQYCGTYFFNICDIDTKKPKYIRIPIGDRTYMFNVIATNVKLEASDSCIGLYADSTKLTTAHYPDYHLSLEMDVLPDNDEIYCYVKQEEGKE